MSDYNLLLDCDDKLVLRVCLRVQLSQELKGCCEQQKKRDLSYMCDHALADVWYAGPLQLCVWTDD